MREVDCEAGAAELRSLDIALTGVNIHAVATEKRPAAVFIHGFAEDLGVWDPLLDALGSDLGSFRYDLRGYGRSHCRDHIAYTHAGDLETILHTIALGRCDLVGASMGGAVALNFALDHPERVNKLVLISPQIVAWEWSDTWVQGWQQIEQSARAGKLDEARRLWWDHPVFATTRPGSAGHMLYDSIMRYEGEQWIGDHHELMFPDLERLHLLQTPTLLLTGGRDLEDFRLIAALIEASVPNLRRIDDPMRGHLLHLEDPGCCAERIREFLSGSGSPRR
jgi:pimeloyl-ACP methyl ester carboxylesterase